MSGDNSFMYAKLASPTPAEELKFMPFSPQLAAKDGRFEGYASLFNVIDLNRDKILPGAFSASLKQRPANEVKLLFQHDSTRPIGVWEQIIETNKGLYCRGRFLLNIRFGHEAYELLKAGALDGLSIGFRAIKAKRDYKTKIRQITKADLYEISLVTFPMNKGARARALKKGAGGFATIREFERWLVRDAGFTRREAKLAVEKGFKHLASKRICHKDRPLNFAQKLTMAKGLFHNH